MDGKKRKTVLHKDDRPSNHCGFVVMTAKPVWILSENEGAPLEASENYVDHWSESIDLPRYEIPDNSDLEKPIRTAVLIPVSFDQSLLGVLDFESSHCLEYQPRSAGHFRDLADAVGTIYGLFRNFVARDRNTRNSLVRLDESADTPLRLTKPRVFVASSSDADKKVIASIRSVLSDFDTQMEVEFWYDVSKSGNITKHLLEAIQAAEFGVCYFSEPSGEKSSPTTPMSSLRRECFRSSQTQQRTAHTGGYRFAKTPHHRFHLISPKSGS